MKKLAAIVIVSGILIVLIVALAFFYIDFSGHSSLSYKIVSGEKILGEISIDKYVTEDKIAYKSVTKDFFSSGYPIVNEKLFLKKQNRVPVKFIREVIGAKGWKRLMLFVLEDGKNNFLFLEYPRFMALEDINSGKNKILFSSGDIMLYMPLMDKYNFWRRGTQFLDVLILLEETVPPVSDRVRIKYITDEYIPVMGHRAEAERFEISSELLPKTTLFLSKYTRRILKIEITGKDSCFVLDSCIENPAKRLVALWEKSSASDIFSGLAAGRAKAGRDKAVKDASVEGFAQDFFKAPDKKDIFFESKNIILSGMLFLPKGKGPFPGIVLVPKEFSRTNGEQALVDFFAEFLSREGYVVLVFDNPGQGKSQGSRTGMSEMLGIEHIVNAAGYLNKLSDVKSGDITLIGHESSGYLVLKAAEAVFFIRSCVLLNLPICGENMLFQEASKQNIGACLNDAGLGSSADKIIEDLAERAGRHQKQVVLSNDEFSFFAGIKVPVKEYKSFLTRKIRDAVLSFKGPILLIWGRGYRYFDSQSVSGLKEPLLQTNNASKISVLKNSGDYLGGFKRGDNSIEFEIDGDCAKLIKNWLKSNPGKTTEEADTVIAESFFTPSPEAKQ
ncbi:MAG: hypothetical protein ABH869_08045 [Candidatus Omnitrophota bacterium]